MVEAGPRTPPSTRSTSSPGRSSRAPTPGAAAPWNNAPARPRRAAAEDQGVGPQSPNICHVRKEQLRSVPYRARAEKSPHSSVSLEETAGGALLLTERI